MISKQAVGAMAIGETFLITRWFHKMINFKQLFIQNFLNARKPSSDEYSSAPMRLDK